MKNRGTIIKFNKKSYGFIEGDNGRRYFFHKKNTKGPMLLKDGTRVTFYPRYTERGLVASRVKQEKIISELRPLSVITIKFLLLFILIIQIITLYLVFEATA